VSGGVAAGVPGGVTAGVANEVTVDEPGGVTAGGPVDGPAGGLRIAPAGIDARDWGWRHAGRRAWAVSELSLQIEPGERVLLLGASGSGKSTLLAGLAGLLHGQQSGESRGTLRVDGCEPHDARHRSGLVLQDPETQLVMSRAGDDVAFGPENYGVPTEQIWPRVSASLATVGFPYGRARLTAELSGGEKQRLALAGILANEPGLLLLDEPTANLDPAGAALVRSAVGRVLDRTGATMVLVEHRVGAWLALIDRVVVLAAGGGLIADGAPGQVFGRARAELVAAGVWLPSHRLDFAPVGGAGSRSSTSLTGAKSSPTSVALTVDRVRLRYPRADVDAVSDASLRLQAGAATAVTGGNGSGKSTLALMAAGLLAPTAGRAFAADRPGQSMHRRRPSSLVRAVGTVFQNPEHQFLTTSVRSELALAPGRLGWAPARVAARVEELLERLELTALAEANPFTLSGGQKRRLSVATALSAAAPVLVLDEPTFGQDARTWAALAELLDAARDDGHALLIVSHDEEFVARVADDVRVMTAGGLA
jgi:energy-coupling factor transporter ATP-binding protein EcfA2